MITPVLKEHADRQNRLMNLLWRGHFVTYGIYYYIIQTYQSGADSTESDLRAIFFVAGTASALAGILLNRSVFSSLKIYNLFKKPAMLPEELKKLSGPDQEIHRIIAGSFSYFTISIGLVENCAVFGLISSIIYSDQEIFYIHLIISIVGSIFCKPRMDRLLEELGKTHD